MQVSLFGDWVHGGRGVGSGVSAQKHPSRSLSPRPEPSEPQFSALGTNTKRGACLSPSLFVTQPRLSMLVYSNVIATQATANQPSLWVTKVGSRKAEQPL